jgi:hypothetical protein
MLANALFIAYSTACICGGIVALMRPTGLVSIDLKGL